jgi:hypothetical protein
VITIEPSSAKVAASDTEEAAIATPEAKVATQVAESAPVATASMASIVDAQQQ